MARTKKIDENAGATNSDTARLSSSASRPSPLIPLIFLIGSRGSGKSTTARMLADRLGWMWVDADDVVEQRFGKIIKDMFAEDGEVGFRDKESAVFHDLCRARRHVIATGGGIVLRPENRELLGRSGWCIWLAADVETLFQRLQDDPTTPTRRPNLTAGGIKEISEILKAREDLYRACADFTVQTGGRSPVLVVQDIVREWTVLNGEN